jgi:hypothetical protein
MERMWLNALVNEKGSDTISHSPNPRVCTEIVTIQARAL